MKSLEKKGELMAKKIATTFENKSYALNFIQRSHFMVRLYHTTKNNIFLNPIIERFLLEKEKIIEDFEHVNNKKYIKKRSIELFMELKEQGGIKNLRRIKLFRSRREFLFYYHILQHLYFWKMIGISKSKLGGYFRDGIVFLKKFLKDEDFDRFFFDDNMIKYFGTQLINCIYYLKFLKVIDITEKFTTRFREVFDDDEDKFLSEYLYKNKIYGLTHFIIAGTDYYQRFSSVKEFGWVISYFKKNIKTILKRTDPDIVSEVGLCFKLCRTNPKKELDMIREYVIGNFSERLGYIPRSKGGLNASEHTAAVSYLFLSNFKRVYKGPNIQKEIDKKI